MTEVTAQEALASRDCKIPGCADQAVIAIGRYALLCDRHAAAKRSGELVGEPRHPRSGGRHTGGFEKKTQRLTAAARALDRAITAHKKTRGRLDAALAEWESAKRDLSVKVQEAE